MRTRARTHRRCNVLGDYGVTPEELVFILNYNIKYSLGRGVEDEEE